MAPGKAGKVLEMSALYDQGLANLVGPESCPRDGKVLWEALRGEGARQVVNRETVVIRGTDTFVFLRSKNA